MTQDEFNWLQDNILAVILLLTLIVASGLLFWWSF